jgi:aspartate aminotransferase-like enzyme
MLETKNVSPQSWTPDFRFIDFPYDKKSLVPHTSSHSATFASQSNSQNLPIFGPNAANQTHNRKSEPLIAQFAIQETAAKD